MIVHSLKTICMLRSYTLLAHQLLDLMWMGWMVLPLDSFIIVNCRINLCTIPVLEDLEILLSISSISFTRSKVIATIVSWKFTISTACKVAVTIEFEFVKSYQFRVLKLTSPTLIDALSFNADVLRDILIMTSLFVFIINVQLLTPHLS